MNILTRVHCQMNLPLSPRPYCGTKVVLRDKESIFFPLNHYPLSSTHMYTFSHGCTMQIQMEGKVNSRSSLLTLSHSSVDLLVGEALHMTEGSCQKTSPSCSPLFFANKSLLLVQQLSTTGLVKTTSITTHTASALYSSYACMCQLKLKCNVIILGR